MAVLHKEEFQNQSQVGANSTRIYQGKCLKAGPVFSTDNLKAAGLYCRRFNRKQNGAMCIIVREESFLRIWSEILQTAADTNQNVEDADEEISINSLPVQTEFADFCQQLLADEIGPIANLICKKILTKNPDLTREEFVKILVKKISDPTLAQKFEQATLE